MCQIRYVLVNRLPKLAIHYNRRRQLCLNMIVWSVLPKERYSDEGIRTLKEIYDDLRAWEHSVGFLTIVEL